MEIAPDLVRRLKRLRLGGLLRTLPDRVTHARQTKLAPRSFSSSCSKTKSIAATARAWSGASRPPASRSSSPTSSSSGIPR